VLDALLDAVDSGALEEEITVQALEVIKEVTLIWNLKYWTEIDAGGYYWYSESPNDNIECVNITAKMAGSFARVLQHCKFTAEQEKLIKENISLALNRVVELAYYDEEHCLVWKYLTRANSSPNDAIHHTFILEGIKSYEEAMGQDIIFGDDEMLEYIEKCVDKAGSPFAKIYSYPDFEHNKAFDCGAIPLLEDVALKGTLIRNAYKQYVEEQETDTRQLSFLLYAMADYISETTLKYD